MRDITHPFLLNHDVILLASRIVNGIIIIADLYHITITKG